MKSAETDAEQTNIEKFLLAWCQEQTKGFVSRMPLENSPSCVHLDTKVSKSMILHVVGKMVLLSMH